MAEKDVVKDATAEENTVAKDIVVTKYKMAAEIVNGAVTAWTFCSCYIYAKGKKPLLSIATRHLPSKHAASFPG